MGLGAEDLHRRHPNVIPVEIDGYGPGGPLSHKRAYDLLVQAESGTCAATGYPGMPPSRARLWLTSPADCMRRCRSWRC